MYINKSSSDFTQRELADALRVWNCASISLVDIRHNLISPEEPVKAYRLPSSAFVYTGGGKAEVFLNDTPYRAERFGLFHGGKGTELSIRPVDDWLEYYMILYKAGESAFHKREFAKLLERVNPFQQQYGFVPENPIFFGEQLRRMYEAWKQPDSLELFFEKSAFYQFVYEVYRELYGGSVRLFQPNIADMAKRYIDQYYSSTITVSGMAHHLGISTRQLTRVFKEATGQSTQDYLIVTRLNASKQLLRTTKASLREIALATGFSDEFYFSRLFKSHYQISPQAFRLNSPWAMSDLSMESASFFPYNDESRVSFDKLNGEGVPFMFRQMRNKAVVAAALSLLLLMSACGTPAANTGGTEFATTSAVTTQTEETTTIGEGTRTVSTVMGDVEVPMNPQRIAVQYLMGDVISLGITPVGVSDVYDGAAFSELLSDSASLGHQTEWDQESVMTLNPDLILVINEDYVEKFSKIAPTVYIPYGDMTQDERLTFIGEVLNRQEEAAAEIEAYHTTLEEAKAKLLQAGFEQYTVSVFEGGFDEMIAMGSKYGTGAIIYAELGLTPPEAVQTNIIDEDTYNALISFEVLQEFSGDFIFRNAYEGMDDLSQSDVWNSLPAVHNNRVIEIEFGLSFYADIYSATAQINYVTEALLHAGE